MPRVRDPERLRDLISAAADVFIATGGYRRTQMADIAAAMGVAPGTLYLYVESKEALFDLLIRHLDLDDTGPLPQQFPIPTPRPGVTLTFLKRDVAKRRGKLSETLTRALESNDSFTLGDLEQICREIFRSFGARRRRLKLIDKCARDFPDLAKAWFEGVRPGFLHRLAEYLSRGHEQGVIDAGSDPFLTARAINEILVYWSVHQYYDARPVGVTETELEELAVKFALGGMVKATRRGNHGGLLARSV